MGFNRSLILGLGAVALTAVFACKPAKKNGASPVLSSASQHQPDFVMKPFQIQSYNAGALEWQLNAPMAEAYTASNLMRATQVDLLLFEKGKKSTDIQSEKGVFCLQSGAFATGSANPDVPAVVTPPVIEQGKTLKPGDMFLSGNVVVVSTDGSKLLTDWLLYDRTRDVIRSTAPVQLIRADSVTQGIGLEATSNLSTVEIFNQTLVIPDDEEKK